MNKQWMLIPVLAVALVGCQRDRAEKVDPNAPRNPSGPVRPAPLNPTKDSETGMIDSNMMQTQTDNDYYNRQNAGYNNTNVGNKDSEDTLTPANQSESLADRTITQSIRKSLMADDTLSTKAKNVKIITINGTVTLKGEVNTAQEKNDIEAKAKATTGVKNLTNDIQVRLGNY